MFTKLVKVTARFLLLFLFLFISSNPLEAAVGHMVPDNIERKMSFSTVFHLYFSWYFYSGKTTKYKCLNCLCLKVLVHDRAAGDGFNSPWLAGTSSGPEDPLGSFYKNLS